MCSLLSIQILPRRPVIKIVVDTVLEIVHRSDMPGSCTADGTGEIDFDKFCEVMESMGKECEMDELKAMFQEIDDDDGGTICANEFADWYVEEEEHQKKQQKRQVGAEVGPSLATVYACHHFAVCLLMCG